MTTKISLQKLPETKEIDGAKRWTEEKGEFVQIAYDETARHIALFELKAGFNRGDHWHGKKEEVFYVAKGKIRALWRDLDTGEAGEILLTPGHKLSIATRIWHIFYGLEDALVVEYSPQKYENSDTFRVDG